MGAYLEMRDSCLQLKRGWFALLPGLYIVSILLIVALMGVQISFQSLPRISEIE